MSIRRKVLVVVVNNASHYSMLIEDYPKANTRNANVIKMAKNEVYGYFYGKNFMRIKKIDKLVMPKEKII